MLGGLAYMIAVSLIFEKWDEYRLPILAYTVLTCIVLAVVAVIRLFGDG